MSEKPVEEEIKENLEALGSEEEQEELEAGEEEESAEYSEVEQEAMKHGWNPEGVEGKRSLSAEEFMDRQKFFDDIRSLKRRNQKLEEQFEALQKHHDRVREKEREKLMDELKLKKKLAYEAEDYDSVVDIDEEISNLKAEKKEDKEESKVNRAEVEDAFQTWVEKNSWYNSDPELRKQADILGSGYIAANTEGNVPPPPEETFEYVEKQIKKLYADKFENNNRKKASPVEGAKRTKAKSKSKYSVSDLPEEDRQIMRTLVRSGALTEEQYLKEYFE